MCLDFDVKEDWKMAKLEDVGNHIYGCEVHSLTDMERKRKSPAQPLATDISSALGLS